MNTAKVLQNRLTKLILNNKEKVRLIDSYQRNMRVIDEAFTTIKEATGLTDIREIQDTFIKGEEQNYNLLTYVDVLNQEIDNLLDSNEALRLRNEHLRTENAHRQALLSDTPDEEKRKQRIQAYIEERRGEVQGFQKMLDKVQPLFKEVLLKLARSRFNRSKPHQAIEYENAGVLLNEANLDEYLSELEEYTNAILLFKGRANKLSNSEIYAKTLGLEELSPKDFKKRVYVTHIPTQDNSTLVSVLNDNKDRVRGYEKLLERKTLEELAKGELELKKQTDATKVIKKK